MEVVFAFVECCLADDGDEVVFQPFDGSIDRFQLTPTEHSFGGLGFRVMLFEQFEGI